MVQYLTIEFSFITAMASKRIDLNVDYSHSSNFVRVIFIVTIEEPTFERYLPCVLLPPKDIYIFYVTHPAALNHLSWSYSSFDYLK